MQPFPICPSVSSVYHPSFSGFLVSSISVSSISFVSCVPSSPLPPMSPLSPLYIWSSLSMISSFSGLLVYSRRVSNLLVPATKNKYILNFKTQTLFSGFWEKPGDKRKCGGKEFKITLGNNGRNPHHDICQVCLLSGGQAKQCALVLTNCYFEICAWPSQLACLPGVRNCRSTGWRSV